MVSMALASWQMPAEYGDLSMRLLMLTQDYPPAIGGIQTYADCLARNWAPLCTDFAVMAPDGSGAAAFDAEQDFDVYRVPMSSDSMRLLVWPHLMRLLREREFDAIFTGHWYVAAAALRARKLGLVKAVFIAAHAQELRKVILPIGLKSFYRWHRRSVLRAADGVFPVSHYTGSLLEADGVDSSRIHIVPNGTEVERFSLQDNDEMRHTFRQKYHLGAHALIGTVARLVPRKGIDTVIKAMPLLLKQIPELSYVVVGDGPDRGRLEALSRELGVDSRCFFLGKIPYEELPMSYKALDCFVMPARQIGSSVEGFGLVFCEASACGVPVIGGRSGGIPDAIVEGRSGVLVEPDDVGALVDGLLPILQNPDYGRELGVFGQSYVEENGTWQVAARRIFSEMRTVCALS